MSRRAARPSSWLRTEMGDSDAHRRSPSSGTISPPSSWARCRCRSSRSGSSPGASPTDAEATTVRRRARLARRSRHHAERARRPPHLRRRARGAAGRGRGRDPRGGSVFLGVAEDTARFLHELARRRRRSRRRGVRARRRRRRAGRSCAPRRRRTPGLGHPVHKDTDPRVPRMYELAAELDLLGPHLRLLQIVAEVSTEEQTRSPAPDQRCRRRGRGARRPRLRLAASSAASRCSRAPPGSSATSRRRCSSSMGMPLWQEIEARSTREGQRSDS